MDEPPPGADKQMPVSTLPNIENRQFRQNFEQASSVKPTLFFNLTPFRTVYLKSKTTHKQRRTSRIHFKNSRKQIAFLI
jgi:hypothetical protein